MSATVRSDSYLTLHYRITTLDGEEFLSTFDMSPATLQMGSGQLAENLESVLIGLPAHERFVFELEPAQGFGEHNPRLAESDDVTDNMSIDTDPQQQAAASPLMLVVRSFLRYVSRAISRAVPQS